MAQPSCGGNSGPAYCGGPACVFIACGFRRDDNRHRGIASMKSIHGEHPTGLSRNGGGLTAYWPIISA